MLVTFLISFFAVPIAALTQSTADVRATSSSVATSPVIAVKSLAPEEIAAAPIVRIRGVVTWSRPGAMFVQDDTAGIYIDFALAHDRGVWKGASLAEPAAVGDEIEIEGMLDLGGFSPPVLPCVVHVAGSGILPQPRPLEPDRFFRGADDGNLIEASGVVQNAVKMGSDWQLTMEAAGKTLLADVTSSALPCHAETLVDGVVRIVGPTASVFTTRGEFIMPRVHVDLPERFAIVEPACRDPFQSRCLPLDGLARYRHEPVAGHRVRTAGVVVHSLPGQAIFVQDGPRGIRVQTKSEEALEPGDRVEVAGFIDRSGGVAGLTNALVRRLAAGPAPAAIDVAPVDILEVNRRAAVTALRATPGDYEGCLVRFPAKLVETQRTVDGGLLLLDAAGTMVTATTDVRTLAGLRGLRTGSELTVTGITHLQWAFDPVAWPPQTAEAVNLLVRSAADVAIVRAASWWTPRRLATLVAAAVAALAAAMSWVWFLRRRVRQQAQALAAEMQSRRDAEVEFEAALRERNRLAANLHDTVLQTVTGIGFQLQACRASSGDVPGRDANHAGIAERMVEHAIKQLRGTVWALHELPPTGSLGDGLRALVDRLGREHGVPIHYCEHGDPAAIDDTVSGALLLVAREALQNALRHAHASAIEVLLRQDAGGGIDLIVQDNGRGFVTAARPGPSRGHFGVEGMIDRMQRIGGSLRIESEPGHGTRVTASGPAVSVAHLSDRTVAVVAKSGSIQE